MKTGILMQVESIAEWSAVFFDLHLAIIGLENQFLVILESGCFTQVNCTYMVYQYTKDKNHILIDVSFHFMFLVDIFSLYMFIASIFVPRMYIPHCSHTTTAIWVSSLILVL